MRLPSLSLLCSLLAACGVNHADTPAPLPRQAGEIEVQNGDFEQPRSGDQIPGWTLSQHAGDPAYEMDCDTRDPGEGKTSFRMTRTRKQVYGLINQVVPLPADVAGKTVVFSALVRTEGVGSRGWRLAVNLMGGNAILDQQRAAPATGTTAWHRESVSFTAPEHITAVDIGAMLLDEGTGWIDDARVQVLDAAAPADPAHRAGDDRNDRAQRPDPRH